jgi:hypothetical protein
LTEGKALGVEVVHASTQQGGEANQNQGKDPNASQDGKASK